MAPNSNFDFSIPWNSSKVEPGDYSLHLKATHNQQVWEWDEDFTIDDDSAKFVNDNDVSQGHSSLWIFILLGIVVLFIFTGLIVFLVKKKNSKKQNK